MKIAFEAQTFLQRHGGISRYFVELITQLDAMEETPRIIAGFHKNTFLAEIAHAVSGLDIHRCHEKLNRLLGAAKRLRFSAETLPWKPDTVHETFFPSAAPDSTMHLS